MKSLRIVVTGSQGQIGWEMVRALPAAHQVFGIGRAQLDLSDLHAVATTLRALKPDVIINAAGYTAVDRAESEPELAEQVNAAAVGVIGETACRLGAAVVHFSTDYVFDGTASVRYLPADQPNPLSVYGRTKLEGERALLQSGAAAIILRTSWVYGMRGKNFVLTILRQAAMKPQLRIVNDQVGCPTWSRSIAHATKTILERGLAGGTGAWSFGRHAGIHHVAASGQTTWFDFAKHIVECARLNPAPCIVPLSTAEFGAAAQRPAYSVLDCSGTEKAFGILMGEWGGALAESFRGGALEKALATSATPEAPNDSLQQTAKTTTSGSDHLRGDHRVGIDRPGDRTAG